MFNPFQCHPLPPGQADRRGNKGDQAEEADQAQRHHARGHRRLKEPCGEAGEGEQVKTGLVFTLEVFEKCLVFSLEVFEQAKTDLVFAQEVFEKCLVFTLEL